MFKYLWIVVILVFYLWWAFEAVKGFIEEIIYTKKYRKSRFKLDYCPSVTAWYIFIHAIAILVWSALEFVLYYMP